MPTPVIPYQTSTATNALPGGQQLRKYPLPIDCPIRLAAYAFDQEFATALSGFPPAQLNLPNSNATFNAVIADANAILTNYSQPSDIGGGRGKFKATFNRVPASWDDFVTMEWTPPGWIGTPSGATTYTARNPYPEEVTVRVHYDYFVVDPSAVLPGGTLDSGGNAIVAAAGADSLLNGNTAAKKVTSAAAIPYIARTYFCNTLEASGNENGNPPYGGIAPTPIYSSHVVDLVQYGGFSAVTGFFVETLPNIQAYQVWCANVAAFLTAGGNPWTGLVWDGGSKNANGTPLLLNIGGNGTYLGQTQSLITQIILKDSVLKPYAGNIWERMTTYALCI